MPSEISAGRLAQRQYNRACVSAARRAFVRSLVAARRPKIFWRIYFSAGGDEMRARTSVQQVVVVDEVSEGQLVCL